MLLKFGLLWLTLTSPNSYYESRDRSSANFISLGRAGPPSQFQWSGSRRNAKASAQFFGSFCQSNHEIKISSLRERPGGRFKALGLADYWKLSRIRQQIFGLAWRWMDCEFFWSFEHFFCRIPFAFGPFSTWWHIAPKRANHGCCVFYLILLLLKSQNQNCHIST